MPKCWNTVTSNMLTYQASNVRLTVAITAMRRAETIKGVIAVKDEAKNRGLMAHDLKQLKEEFESNVSRIRTNKMKEANHHGN